MKIVWKLGFGFDKFGLTWARHFQCCFLFPGYFVAYISDGSPATSLAHVAKHIPMINALAVAKAVWDVFFVVFQERNNALTLILWFYRTVVP